MSANNNLLDDLKARGLVAQMTSEEQLIEHLAKPRTLYCGFDPTADSLHIGSLVPLVTLKRFQDAGHKPLALVGGATGLIGDPSFKAQERKLNTPDVVANWVDKLKAQVSQFIDFDGDNASRPISSFQGSLPQSSLPQSNSAEVVNNLDWTQGLSILDFLRDVGKHFSVNNMINKESVKQRIDRDGAGISFTEFTYMLLQSYDFAELYKQYDCTLQIGGSDQWGNITGGIDLTRRLHAGQAFGMTLPLVTKSDGTKFGKTESGTIWLDSKKTSPYAFYQFWLNTADADVYKFLKYFTFLSVERIHEIEKADSAAQGRPAAQGILAEEVTRLVHGDAGLDAARRITDALFSGDVSVLSEDDFAQLKQDGLPCSTLPENTEGATLASLLVEAGLVSSGKQVKDALGRGAVIINGRSLTASDNANLMSAFNLAEAFYGRFFLLKLGKKKYQLIEAV